MKKKLKSTGRILFRREPKITMTKKKIGVSWDYFFILK